MQREIKLHFVRSLLSVHLPHKKIKCMELGTFKILQQRTNFRENNFKSARMHVFKFKNNMQISLHTSKSDPNMERNRGGEIHFKTRHS